MYLGERGKQEGDIWAVYVRETSRLLENDCDKKGSNKENKDRRGGAFLFSILVLYKSHKENLCGKGKWEREY